MGICIYIIICKLCHQLYKVKVEEVADSDEVEEVPRPASWREASSASVESRAQDSPVATLVAAVATHGVMAAEVAAETPEEVLRRVKSAVTEMHREASQAAEVAAQAASEPEVAAQAASEMAEMAAQAASQAAEVFAQAASEPPEPARRGGKELDIQAPKAIDRNTLLHIVFPYCTVRHPAGAHQACPGTVKEPNIYAYTDKAGKHRATVKMHSGEDAQRVIHALNSQEVPQLGGRIAVQIKLKGKFRPSYERASSKRDGAEDATAREQSRDYNEQWHGAREAKRRSLQFVSKASALHPASRPTDKI